MLSSLLDIFFFERVIIFSISSVKYYCIKCWLPSLFIVRIFLHLALCSVVRLFLVSEVMLFWEQIFYYAPKMAESWKGQKLLSRAEFHVGAHVTKFLRLQMLSASSSDRTGTGPGSDKTNRFAVLFGTLDGSIGCIAPLDEITFRRLQSLQKKLVDAVPHVSGLNPKAFRLFRSNGRAHRPGPDSIVDCELLCQ